MSTRNLINKFICLSLLICIGFLSTFIPSEKAFAANCKSRYTVRANDSLQKLAKKFKLTPYDLIQANKLVSPDYTIYAGQKLCIPLGTRGEVPWKVEPYMTHPAGNFTVENTSFRFLIHVSNFAPFSANKVFVISRTGTPLNAGILNADKNGNATATMSAPPGYTWGARQIKWCVQDPWATVLLCRNVRL